jgi:MoaA/NifB/PqqE/SkfB family radical SAM enzyme
MYPLPTTFHVEPTTLCNAACPMCARNNRGGSVSADLRLQHIPWEVYKPILAAKPECVYFCGNYGEPAMYPAIKKAVGLLRESNIHIGLDTNGGVHDQLWWADLALQMGDNSNATFSLDGLEDTHHLYRRKTTYAHVERSMRAFIDAGGNATWSFLIFKHNEHQVDEARARAKKFGAKFLLKRTARFIDIGGRLSDAFQVCDGSKLEVPTNPEYVNKEMVALSTEDYQKYLDQTHITCKSAGERSVFVSATAHMLPCCWTGLLADPKQHGNERIKLLMDTVGKSSISLLHHSVEEIVKGRIFAEIERGWGCNRAQGRVSACSINCGAHDKFRVQMNRNTP